MELPFHAFDIFTNSSAITAVMKRQKHKKKHNNSESLYFEYRNDVF